MWLHRPLFFWSGVGAVTCGVLLHLPMYWSGRDMGFRLVGMPVDPLMLWGMAAIGVGLAATLYGLFPRRERHVSIQPCASMRALDDSPVRLAHVGLLVVMALAIAIDVMKPTSLAFVLPGMVLEYGLRSPLNPAGQWSAAYLPLAGISGTVIGSFAWGWLGDRIGRRASILFAGVMFIATAICGTMPEFAWNLVMCFLMGLAAGGMLPIAYVLLAETIPARHRSWLLVLIGSDIAGAYIVTSWLAADLVPYYSWRILWLIGLPTGLLLIVLNRWIPESPRFLQSVGRHEQARQVMLHYGIRAVEDSAAIEEPQQRTTGSPHSSGLTFAVAALSVGVGFVLFGFNLWIPSNLRKIGIHDADFMLRNSALIGFPFTFVIAWSYGFWSAKRTVLVLAALSAAALAGFVVAGDRIVDEPVLLQALLVMPIWGISAVISVLSVYTTEIYPTRVRSSRVGLAAGACKVGGVVVIASVAFGLAEPSIRQIALVGAAPIALGALTLGWFGIETRARRLEEISDQRVARSRA